MPTRPSDSEVTTTRPTKIPKMEDSIDVVSASTATAPIPSYRPDAKERRYDRQLRLWASSGQKSLEQARVLLVGCNATGCQSLKNLVLPGISHFTILTDAKTTAQDVATNFFLHPESLGQNVADEAVKYLKELNPAVEGVANVQDPATLLKSEPDFFTSFTLALCCDVDPDLELSIADLLWQHSSTPGNRDVPLMSIRNSGFIGRISIQLREHCVIDTHPDSTHTLRIDQPFPELETYARSLDLDSMDSMEHSHIPYLVLLVRALCDWRDAHEGQAPSFEFRDEFKETLRKGKHKYDEENFDEAIGQAFKCWNTSEIPYEVESLLSRDNVKNITASSHNLHILLHTLGIYLQSHPLPPISPSLPDMHSSTESYITLQNMYKRQYQSDLAEYKSVLDKVLDSVGLPSGAVPVTEIESFVKNSGGVDIVNGSPLSAQRDVKGLTREAINEHFADPESENHLAIAEHLAILAAERYRTKHSIWPGTTSDTTADCQILEESIKEMSGLTALPGMAKEAIVEVVRGGFSSLPTTAAFIGGLVAQEAIKLVTDQYSPLDNTVIVDLVKSTTTAFKL
ncbi:hypothetical protein BD324DRAFT_625903 [Kockovaella imperatae]|uniref:NEDD8-activating enzyme E1 regulatory subunit n=1 Tax=Kockovaella imperatae TaxID=4999 RepID=A0A1Y1UH50_9TREE|nr:hypothetical protein BD324DRAFT_625903 [Kockovaella imperatae]ORX37378.1 hypothetical protein BD324DRAFT_625903 [Kockovaella imperatae]